MRERNCDERCWYAEGKGCRCVCGGVNHGIYKGMKIKTVELFEDEGRRENGNNGGGSGDGGQYCKGENKNESNGCLDLSGGDLWGGRQEEAR